MSSVYNLLIGYTYTYNSLAWTDGLDSKEGSFGGKVGMGGHLGFGVLALSRAQALTGLLWVAVEGLGRSGAVLSGVLVGDTRP